MMDIKMKGRIVICTTILCLLFGTGCGEKPTEVALWKTYVSEEYGFEISLPKGFEDWEIVEHNWDRRTSIRVVDVEKLSAGYLEARIVVLILPLSEPKTVIQAMDDKTDYYRRSYASYREESRRSIKVGGHKGEELIYTYENVPGKESKVVETLFVRDLSVYMISLIRSTYMVYIGKDLPIEEYRSIVSTFRFIHQ